MLRRQLRLQADGLTGHLDEFWPDVAGLAAKVQGRRLPRWNMAHGWAAEVPPEPQDSKEPLEQLTFIPYGCTNIRVAEFPRLRQ